MADKTTTKEKAAPAQPEKKAAARSEKKEIKKQPNRIQRFFRETIGELRKVNWPSRQEALNLTGLVLVVMTIMAILLGAADAGAAWLISLITGV